MIAETVRFIQKMHLRGKQMHIVSGSDVNELKSLCEELGLSKYFLSINGSPTPKSELTRLIIQSSNLKTDNFCLIGDAINDYDAARENAITFFGFNNKALSNLGNYIENFNY